MERDVVQVLSDMRAHDLLTAVIPDEYRLGSPTANYAMASAHQPELEIVVISYDDEVSREFVVDDFSSMTSTGRILLPASTSQD